MNETKQSRWRLLWVVPPMVVGVLVLVFMSSGKMPPPQAEIGEPSQSVRVVGGCGVG